MMIRKSGRARSHLLTPRTFPQPFFGSRGSCSAFLGLGKQLCRSCPAHLQRVSFTWTTVYGGLHPTSFYSPHFLFPLFPPFPDEIPWFITKITSTFLPPSLYLGLTWDCCANYCCWLSAPNPPFFAVLCDTGAGFCRHHFLFASYSRMGSANGGCWRETAGLEEKGGTFSSFGAVLTPRYKCIGMLASQQPPSHGMFASRRHFSAHNSSSGHVPSQRLESPSCVWPSSRFPDRFHLHFSFFQRTGSHSLQLLTLYRMILLLLCNS